ncbi:MAG: FtsQ-type POTRA domain-containing protein [Xanthomonadales bacterium]|nr:cell division protein FtsQ/DivIB [Gammaproteobacteria bacterium]MBT8052585.1 cell division protein FtsQ/DivIB [Gammaproteobacteria bacterium]NND56656.1 FtsQ-type POTRA domain-containing protein [Xanthomonadales bacterium]NNK52402.1 FtsQ-type POTRA domain-containing protein [Xanthomonadales bacterium]
MNRYQQKNQQGSRGFANGMLVVVMLFVLSVGGLAWVSLGILANDRWPIRWLDLNGAFQRVSAEQLRAAMTPLIEESFFTLDLQELDQAARRISWVSSVRIQKEWPDTVRVTIEEYVPIAHWNRGELISEQGDAFAIAEADDLQGLPWLEGPEERLNEVLLNWSEFSDAMASFGLEIVALRLDRRGAWSMRLNNGTRVQLGRDSARERFSRLLNSWESLTRGQALPPQDVDLRYTNGFAVLWPQTPQEAKGTDS